MPENVWLAVGSATPVKSHARHLRAAWERFLGDGRIEAVRAPIADSWRRSQAAGVDPSRPRVAPPLADPDEASERWEAHPLSIAAPLIQDCLGPMAAAAAQLIVVGDAEGTILWIDGPEGVRLNAAETMNFIEGAGWSEGGAGTNAIGLVLAADHAVQVFAA